MKLTPYLNFPGNAEEALSFYQSVLGGEITSMQRFGDSPMPAKEEFKNRVLHATYVFDGNLVMVSDTMNGEEVQRTSGMQLSVDVPEEGKIDDVFTKMAEGGKITMPMQDTFWGARFGMLIDKYGIYWMFNYDRPKL